MVYLVNTVTIDGGNFNRKFKTATSYEPFPYQEKLATMENLPTFIDVPTGAGKTAAIVLAWLWRRRFDERFRDKTPRRLVYCLPMRTLVEQTRDNVILWLHRLELLGGNAYFEDGNARDRVKAYVPSWDDRDKIAVTVLMGGEGKDEWDLYPDRDAIIIGTQDMLLSRALNRGYGMSRYSWPMHFALLNNDCMWVIDEVQLMGVGVETSAQLQAFREKFGSLGNVISIWMSATPLPEQLNTVDHVKPPAGWESQHLGAEDLSNELLGKRFKAKKRIKMASVKLNADANNLYSEQIAKLLLERHKDGTLSMAIVNNVKRAQVIYEQLIKKGRSEANTAVLHSRFRTLDRAKKLELLKKPGDIIIVSTQVVEAGVDISARVLITELAPWPSLVQRFGRCNRYGELEDEAIIEWIDIDDKHTDLASPYDTSLLQTSRNILSNISDAGLKSCASVSYEQPSVIRPVIRRKDVLDLFDTTSDISGNDLDVSRYLRDDKDKDVQVYWRNIGDAGPSGLPSGPSREELCSVSLSEIARYTNRFKGWTWDPLESRWRSTGKGGEIERFKPGQVILLDAKNGGYLKTMGWLGLSGRKETSVDGAETDPVRAMDVEMNEDENSYVGKWILLGNHVAEVAREARELAVSLRIKNNYQEALGKAGLWHDFGKSHEAFQNMLLSGRSDEVSLRKDFWAKSDRASGKAHYWVSGSNGNQIDRSYFRHELASAIAWLQTEGRNHADGDLIAYLIAAHHGKVRLSIRSLPQENEPVDKDKLFARGVWQGDKLPSFPGILPHEIEIDLSIMQMGEGSWLEKMLRVRDNPSMGVFRLAFLEMLLRSADWNVSKRERSANANE